MKNTFYLPALTIIMVFVFNNCNSMRPGKTEKLPEPDRIVFHCNGVSYASDMEFIRARGEGTSRNESTAHRMADLDASANLAKAVDNYKNKVEAFRDRQQMKREAAEIEWEGGTHTRTEINMTLSNVATVCSESSLDDNMYTVVKIVEIPLKQIMAE